MIDTSKPLRIADTSTPVVVLGSTHHCSLEIMRSLGRLGIAVLAVEESRWAPAFFSRYCQGKFVWDLDNSPPEKSVEYLTDIARGAGRRCVLMPTTDLAAIFVADHTPALEEWFIFPSQSPTLVRSLCSKRKMHDLARKFCVPTPLTVCPETASELRQLVDSMDLPIILKGDGNLKTPGSKTKLILRTRREFADLINVIGAEKTRNLIVQEYISGGEDATWMFNGYFNERSDCLIGFTGRTLHRCPVYTGDTSLGICQTNEAVEASAKKFMKALGYRGILDVGFRYDARDGRYKVFDVNPRIGSTFRLFVSGNGMDVARALYLDLTGQPVVPARAPDGRKWIVEDMDLVASFCYGLQGKLTFGEWLRSFRGIQEPAVFAAEDPLPALLMFHSDVSEFLWRLKLRRTPVPPFEYRSSAPDRCYVGVGQAPNSRCS